MSTSKQIQQNIHRTFIRDRHAETVMHHAWFLHTLDRRCRSKTVYKLGKRINFKQLSFKRQLQAAASSSCLVSALSHERLHDNFMFRLGSIFRRAMSFGYDIGWFGRRFNGSRKLSIFGQVQRVYKSFSCFFLPFHCQWNDQEDQILSR